MAKSQYSVYSPRIAKKAFRAEAKQKGLTFRAAAEARTKELAEKKVLKPVGLIRRNPGREDGVQWNGASFICPHELQDNGLSVVDSDDDEDYTVWYEQAPNEAPESHTLSIWDIARPAKVKGTAKEFEMIKPTRHVITLEDEESALFDQRWEDDDEWEKIYGEEYLQEATLYSAVLRGNEG